LGERIEIDIKKDVFKKCAVCIDDAAAAQFRSLALLTRCCSLLAGQQYGVVEIVSLPNLKSYENHKDY